MIKVDADPSARLMKQFELWFESCKERNRKNSPV
jgi:hypothetical protein